MIELRSGAATDIGLVRATNQDQLLVAAPLFAVADGMGGHAAGEVASRVAVDALEAAFTELPEKTPAGLGAAAHQANRAVWDHAQTAGELRGMGTTLVALALVTVEGREVLAVANVGDSRAYRLRDEELEQLTIDHSLVQELVDEGQLAEEEAAYHPQRHVLTRALGVDPDVAVDVLEVEPTAGDRFLLCSDGLIREVGDGQVASILRRLDDPDDAARELVSQAKEHGGNDNITVVVVDVVEGAGDAPPTVAAELPAPATVELEKETPPAAPRRSWIPWRRSRQHRQRAPLTRPITLRVVAFFVLLVGILGIAAGGIGLYARGSYFVGLSGGRLVIFQGRPGGLLWFRPTIARRTAVTTADVLPYHLGALRAGQSEGSLDAAQAYVSNLEAEYQAAHPAAVATGPAPTTTTPPPTS